MWTNHAVWTGGLGSTDNTNWAPDWTVVASQSGISLLQSPSPEGMSFIVVINQGQPNEKRLFPRDFITEYGKDKTDLVNKQLIKEGHAYVYEGGKKKLFKI